MRYLFFASLIFFNSLSFANTDTLVEPPVTIPIEMSAVQVAPHQSESQSQKIWKSLSQWISRFSQNFNQKSQSLHFKEFPSDYNEFRNDVFSDLNITNGLKLLQDSFYQLNDKLKFTLQNDENYKTYVRHFDRKLQAQVIDKGTRNYDFHVNAIIQDGPSPKFLYSLNSGVTEGYTIGEHTVRVLSEFNLLLSEKCFDLEYLDKALKQIKVHHDFSVFMAYTLALHDIGKGIAVVKGDKNWEEYFSMPIASSFAPQLQFSKFETELIASLIETHQEIGVYLKANGEINILDPIQTFTLAAHSLNMDKKLYFRLAEALFFSDAGSYPYLNEKVFEHGTNGCIYPKSYLYSELAKTFSGVKPF